MNLDVCIRNFCHNSNDKITDTILSKIFPLNRMLQFHIHLGYTMVLIIFLAVAFGLFFGLFCRDGEQQFYDNCSP